MSKILVKQHIWHASRSLYPKRALHSWKFHRTVSWTIQSSHKMLWNATWTVARQCLMVIERRSKWISTQPNSMAANCLSRHWLKVLAMTRMSQTIASMTSSRWSHLARLRCLGKLLVCFIRHQCHHHHITHRFISNSSKLLTLFFVANSFTLLLQYRDSLKRRITLENKVETENLTHTFEVSEMFCS